MRDGTRLAHRPQLADEVAQYLRDLIVSGRVRHGEFLRLEPVADQLGTSVTPVREALLALRGEGFVTLQPRRGFVVAPFSRQDILDVYAVQAHLAGELAARACAALDSEAVAGIVSVQEELESAHRAGDAELVERLNHTFHRRINVAADSPKLAQFLVTATRYSPRNFFSEIAGWTQASAADHRAIIQALETGDAEAARDAMARHVANAGALLADYLESRGVWIAPPPGAPEHSGGRGPDHGSPGSAQPLGRTLGPPHPDA
ncbi:MAG: GntR family transcriptional regulator [Marmoricola sp.]